jgi:prepilin-type N-terminal cleavage/methylation domain-containing protein
VKHFTPSRRGFTLIELLAVVAIIGLLIGLILPAVQSARESARRASCANNIKQIGLAIQLFHQSYQRLPPGGSNDQPPFGLATPNHGWGGSSCFVHLLPYLEQMAVYSRWDFVSPLVSQISPSAAVDVVLPWGRCPSSNMPQWRTWDTTRIAVLNYHPVAGAQNGLITNPAYNETRIADGLGGAKNGWGGMIFPSSQMTFAHCTDGSSNMLVFGEQSGMLVDTSGVSQAWSPSSRFGWPLGAAYTGPSTGFVYNVTTIRWPINQKTGWDGVTNGVGSGQSSGWPTNVPLNSNHPGGVSLLLLDGSVRFAADDMTMQTLAQLATRNDRTGTGDF